MVILRELIINLEIHYSKEKCNYLDGNIFCWVGIKILKIQVYSKYENNKNIDFQLLIKLNNYNTSIQDTSVCSKSNVPTISSPSLYACLNKQKRATFPPEFVIL
jgi:hypothetical protein